ncbi:MAG: nucleotidyltransferase family protein [Oligoflexia bacterium]|nr:nucleotidyltransferase family protein [Oligoflexia bacterium]
MNKKSIIKTCFTLKNEIRKEYKAEILGLFGSYARGEESHKSDIDFLVDFYGSASLFDLVGLKDFLKSKFKRKIDIVTLNSLRPELKDNIFKQLIKI